MVREPIANLKHPVLLQILRKKNLELEVNRDLTLSISLKRALLVNNKILVE